LKLGFEFFTCSFILEWAEKFDGTGRAMKRNSLLFFVLAAAVLTSTGCNVKRHVYSFLPTRIAREFTSEQTNFHTITPIQGDLRRYKVLAVKKFENLMLGEMPVGVYNFLNDQLVKEISQKKLFQEVHPFQYEEELEPKESAPPTLILAGYVDNFNPGSRGLRFVELGLNHAVVTLRFQLQDWQTQQTLASASVTVYERASSKTAITAIHRAARSVAEFIRKGDSQAPKSDG
jgi:hypothetical protein